MNMWGALKTLETDANFAVGATLSMLDTRHELNNLWDSRRIEHFELGIGINSGSPQLGDIGSSPRFKIGPLRAIVNPASRVKIPTGYLRGPLVAPQHSRNQP